VTARTGGVLDVAAMNVKANDALLRFPAMRCRDRYVAIAAFLFDDSAKKLDGDAPPETEFFFDGAAVEYLRPLVCAESSFSEVEPIVRR
jgi:hypothetical protein